MKGPTGTPLVAQGLRRCAFPPQGPQVQSLARELRSFMPCNVAQKRNINILFKKSKDQQREGVGQNERSRRTKRKGSTGKGGKGRTRMKQTNCFSQVLPDQRYSYFLFFALEALHRFHSIYFKLTCSGTKATLSEAPYHQTPTLAAPRTPGPAISSTRKKPVGCNSGKDPEIS